ncbi:MAG TPA: CpsD/CapB family tyrosine-protein kinase [Patescibacteria group bacterium]|nr:CpsD/CapB family tyrosine-protein kinase [Patescibacteria group bacterium]
MERMQRAIEKAREQRQKTTPPPSAPVKPRPTPSVAAQTRAVPLSEATLAQNRLVARSTDDAAADIFRVLRTQVLQQMTTEGYSTLAVISCNPSEGKSLVAANLAVSLAMDVKQTVLLADLDFRHPSVHRYFGIVPETGLSDYLNDGTPLADCLLRPDLERLVLLPINKPVDGPAEMLATPKMTALAQELKSRYADRIIIYDMPPLLTTSDTLAFLPHLDAVLLVVEERRTTEDDLKRAMRLLAGHTLIGTVVNKSATPTLSETYNRR